MATSIKVKLLTQIRNRRRRDSTIRHTATGVTSHSELCVLTVDPRHVQTVVRNAHYVFVGCRVNSPPDEMTYVDVMEHTKVSIMLCICIFTALHSMQHGLSYGKGVRHTRRL